jgi:hypothetical protein
MVKGVKTTGLALVAVIVLGLAGTAAASAHEFFATETSKVESEAVGSQEFQTAVGTITCSKVKLTETSTMAGKKESQLAKAKYTGCTAYGLFEAKIAPVEYEFLANETAKLRAQVTIEVPLDECQVKLKVQGPLSTVKYKNELRNTHKGIRLEPSLSAITSEGIGGCEYASENKGVYRGSSFVWETGGGTVEWK